MKPKRSKINYCATTSCGSVLNLKPQFSTSGKLYFLCWACSFILQKMEESVGKEGGKLA